MTPYYKGYVSIEELLQAIKEMPEGKKHFQTLDSSVLKDKIAIMYSQKDSMDSEQKKTVESRIAAFSFIADKVEKRAPLNQYVSPEDLSVFNNQIKRHVLSNLTENQTDDEIIDQFYDAKNKSSGFKKKVSLIYTKAELRDILSDIENPFRSDSDGSSQVKNFSHEMLEKLCKILETTKGAKESLQKSRKELRNNFRYETNDKMVSYTNFKAEVKRLTQKKTDASKMNQEVPYGEALDNLSTALEMIDSKFKEYTESPSSWNALGYLLLYPQILTEFYKDNKEELKKETKKWDKTIFEQNAVFFAEDLHEDKYKIRRILLLTLPYLNIKPEGVKLGQQPKPVTQPVPTASASVFQPGFPGTIMQQSFPQQQPYMQQSFPQQQPYMQQTFQQQPVIQMPVSSQPVVQQPIYLTTAALLQNAEIYLKRGSYLLALREAEKVIIKEPENEKAWWIAFLGSISTKDEKFLGKKMTGRVRKRNKYYLHLKENGSEEIKSKLEKFVQQTKRRKRTRLIINLIVLAILVFPVYVIGKKGFEFAYGYIPEAEYTNVRQINSESIEWYKQKSQNLLNQTIVKNVHKEGDYFTTGYTDSVSDPEYLGYCLAKNDEESDLYCIYSYTATSKAESSSPHTSFYNELKVYTAVCFPKSGMRKNGQPYAGLPNLVHNKIVLANTGNVVYDLSYTFEYDGFESFGDLKNYLDKSYKATSYSISLDKVNNAVPNTINLFYKIPLETKLLEATMDENFHFIGDGYEPYKMVSYQIPDGFKTLTFSYSPDMYYFYEGDEVTVEVVDCNSGRVFYTGENVKPNEVQTVNVDISGHQKIAIQFSNIGEYSGYVFVKDIYLSKDEIHEENVEEAEDEVIE